MINHVKVNDDVFNVKTVSTHVVLELQYKTYELQLLQLGLASKLYGDKRSHKNEVQRNL